MTLDQAKSIATSAGMNDTSIFTAALGLQKPWTVTKSNFEIATKELHIHIDFPNGSQFACPECQSLCSIYDSEEKVWRHLDFFQHKAFLHARVPRANCKIHGALKVVVPWARPSSGFTLLFEVLILTLAKSMPVKAIANLIGEHDTLVWRIIRHHVDDARARVDMSTVKTIGVDETSVRKNHKYITIFVDIPTSRVLFATPGKDGDTLLPFIGNLCDHGGRAQNIKEISMDMSPAFISGAREHFSDAAITFDKFHVTKLITDAIEEIRREEQKESPEHYELLKNARFALLKNSDNLPDWMEEKLDRIRLSSLNLKSARAWRLKQSFQEAYNLPGKLGAEQLKKWCGWATRSKLGPMISAAKTIMKNWEGIVHYFKSNITNAILESINAIFQAARSKARGYRNVDYATTILYLLTGGLDLPSLNKIHSK